MTRTEIGFDGLAAPSHVFVSEGILSDWEFELPSGREDNDFYTLNASTGEISLRNNQERPPFGSGKIFLRARATDGTGVVIERPYSLWILGGDEERLADDLDPTMLPVEVPPFVTRDPIVHTKMRKEGHIENSLFGVLNPTIPVVRMFAVLMISCFSGSLLKASFDKVENWGFEQGVDLGRAILWMETRISRG